MIVCQLSSGVQC